MNHQIKKTIIFYFYPLVAFRRWVIKQKKNYLGHHNPEKLAKLLYRRKFHKELNLNNPQTFNEKVNWLKFRSDTSLWTELADKYKVREYIKNNGLEEILVKLYGKWDRVEDISFLLFTKVTIIITWSERRMIMTSIFMTNICGMRMTMYVLSFRRRALRCLC